LPKFFGYLNNFQKLPKVSNQTEDKNCPNLVTLERKLVNSHAGSSVTGREKKYFENTPILSPVKKSIVDSSK
jgi:hypothetical protein